MPLGANKAAIFGVAGVSTGDVVLLSSQTASNSASITFSSGIDSTYGEYIFGFYNVNPVTGGAHFTWQANVVDASGYNETMTTTWFEAVHDEGDTGGSVLPQMSNAQAEGTAYNILARATSSAADSSAAGHLHIFNPSGTTYVTHFIGRAQTNDSAASGGNCKDEFSAGYFNVTGAIDDIQFKYSSGNFDGVIKMWGVK